MWQNPGRTPGFSDQTSGFSDQTFFAGTGNLFLV